MNRALRLVMFLVLGLATMPAYAQDDTTSKSIPVPSNRGSFTLFGHHTQARGIKHHHPDSARHNPIFGKYEDSLVHAKAHFSHLRKYHSGLLHVSMRHRDVVEFFMDVAKETGMSFTYVGNVDLLVSADIKSFSIDYLVDEVAYQNGMLATKEHGRYIIYGNDAEKVVTDKKVIYTYYPRNMDYGKVVAQSTHLDLSASVYTLDNQNALMISGTLEEVRDAVAKFRVVDILPQMVSIELLVVEYNHGKKFNWGFDVTSGQAGRLSDGNYNPLSGLGFTYSFLGQLTPNFKFNLSALVADDYANVVTNPHLVTMNNQQAEINITERRYVQLQTASINGITTNLQNVDAGIKLNVTPVVMSDGNVQLMIEGDNSVFLLDQSTAAVNTLSNTINTNVTMMNGETLIIGGLIQADESDSKSGFPLLRRVPVVNLLFGDFAKQKNYLETVIYITVHVDPLESPSYIKSDEDARTLEKRLKTIDKKLNRKGIRKSF